MASKLFFGPVLVFFIPCCRSGALYLYFCYYFMESTGSQTLYANSEKENESQFKVKVNQILKTSNPCCKNNRVTLARVFVVVVSL